LLPLISLISLILAYIAGVRSLVIRATLSASIFVSYTPWLSYILWRAWIGFRIVVLSVTRWLNFTLTWALRVLEIMALTSRVLTRSWLALSTLILVCRDIHLVGCVDIWATVQIWIRCSPWGLLDLTCGQLFEVSYARFKPFDTLLLTSVSVTISGGLCVNILALLGGGTPDNLGLGIALSRWLVSLRLVVWEPAPATIVSFSHLRKYCFLKFRINLNIKTYLKFEIPYKLLEIIQGN
jgi:hypothetical protein